MTEERNPLDQLVELFVYAPIGLLYEREDVLPRLVTRGRSQVQLARVLGQLALRRGQGQVEERLLDVLGSAGGGLARLVTEVGTAVGLAPPQGERAAPATRDPAPTAPAGSRPGAGAAASGGPRSTAPLPDPGAGERGSDAAPAAPLPIAGYDRLPAREIIPLLADLTPDQRRRVAEHERAGRGRKTVLHQLERLGA